jgi:hypothetical protein
MSSVRYRSPMRALHALALLALGACAPSARPAPSLEEQIDSSVRRAVEYLVAQQESDGAWRSHTYGALKDGWSLTAACTKALLFAPTDGAGALAAERGLAFLASGVGAGGEIDVARLALPYPVYTASLAVVALARAAPEDPERFRAPREAWLRFLCAQQLGEAQGWSSADSAYGGWGYGARPPRRDEPHDFEADLSSTLFALGALRLAGRSADDPVLVRARGFVERCQNLPLSGEAPDAARDDGGFFMSPSVPLQNKAGSAWASTGGRQRFASYGSMSADGLRALLRCGFATDHERVRAALGWLGAHFETRINPGDFEAVRAVEREAAWHYWSWSCAHALVELGVGSLETPGGPRDWAAESATELLARQRPDGSWSNPATMVKEDDPLVATPLALGSLVLARLSLALRER